MSVKSSVNAHHQIHNRQEAHASSLVTRGRGWLGKKDWRQAKAAFQEAAGASQAMVPSVVDAYVSAADSTRDRRTKLRCHREVKGVYKALCNSIDASSPGSRGDAGRTWHALATQYSKLSALKTYNGHDTRRAIDGFSWALEHMDAMDRPAGYRGRLDAATAWLAHHRKDARLWHKERQLQARAQAWEDALMLLRTPAWSQVFSSTWEGVADLSGACRDRVSAQTVMHQVVPLLDEALCRLPQGPGHGNPWHAAAALMTFHPTTLSCVLVAMRRAVADNQVTVMRLPAALSCYDRALITQPKAALDAVEDLATLRARFWNEAHAMGNLVFVSGRFMEKAQKYGRQAAGRTVLEVIGDVAEYTPNEEAASTAVSMLGYVAKKMPAFGEGAVDRLFHLGQARQKRGHAATEAFHQAIYDALSACCQKPVARPVRTAARAALDRLQVSEETGIHAE